MAAFQHANEPTATGLGWLLDAGDGAVVTLVAGETRLLAHRAVLTDRSPVFEAMFRHDTVEASSGEIAIPDVEGPVLRQLLEYLYTLQVPQLPGMAPQLLAAADKYGMSALKEACEQQVAAQLCVETAAAAAVLAVRHSCDSLTQAAVNFIKAHNYQVMSTQGWADAVRRQPEDVVELSRLLAESRNQVARPVCSAPPPEDSGTRPSPSAQPPSARSQTPASATAASSHAAPPDDDAVARHRSLPPEEKTRRLMQAAREGAVGELEALLAAGADVAARDTDRWNMTALHWAGYKGHEEAARRLLAAGAAVDARSSMQLTPLHWAAGRGHAAVVRLLLENGADHGARTVRGTTPLHWAAERGHREAAAALLEAGADRAARDNGGDTPLDNARQNNHQQVVQLLEGS